MSMEEKKRLFVGLLKPIIDETLINCFNCVGFNTNSFLWYTGGMNKGRPNAEDLKLAEEFV